MCYLGKYGNFEKDGNLGNFEKDNFFCVSSVSDVIGVSKPTVRRLIRDQKLPAVRIGKKYFVKKCDLDTFIEESSVKK
jgi:excisionase family DNA binding protein